MIHTRRGVRAIPACNAAERDILHIIDLSRQFAQRFHFEGNFLLKGNFEKVKEN